MIAFAYLSLPICLSYWCLSGIWLCKYFRDLHCSQQKPGDWTTMLKSSTCLKYIRTAHELWTYLSSLQSKSRWSQSNWARNLSSERQQVFKFLSSQDLEKTLQNCMTEVPCPFISNLEQTRHHLFWMSQFISMPALKLETVKCRPEQYVKQHQTRFETNLRLIQAVNQPMPSLNAEGGNHWPDGASILQPRIRTGRRLCDLG